MYATHIDLSISIREEVAAILQQHLVDGVDLFTQLKQASWNVKGPDTVPLRRLFRAVAKSVQRACDSVATRIVALGGRAEATARITALRSTIIEFPSDVEQGLVYVAAVAARVSLFGKGIRASIARVANCGDLVTAELLTAIAVKNDQELEILDAHLQVER